VLRTYAAFLAGANGMPWRRFLVFNAAGATIWATLFGVGSYTLGNTIKTISSTLTWVMVGVAVVVIGIGVSVTRRHEARLIATAHDYLAAEDSGHKSEQPGTEESIRTVDPRS
jgi:membrane protein DedA with SNARE-associated domain